MMYREASYRFELMAEYESCLLRNKPYNTWEGEFRDNVAGLPVIRRRVQTLFEEFLISTWLPSILNSLKLEIASLLRNQYAMIGLPCCGPPSTNVELLSHFQTLLEIAKSAARELDLDCSSQRLNSWSVSNLHSLVTGKVCSMIKSYGNSFSLDELRGFENSLFCKYYIQ